MNDQNIVIDNGSNCKMGINGLQEPSFILHTYQFNQNLNKISLQNIVQNQFQDQWSSPVSRGVVKDWDMMSKIWNYCFEKELKMNPKQHKILISSVPNTPLSNKQQMTEILFESFQVPALYVQDKARLSAYSSGRVTAFIVYSGDGITYTFPIMQGYSLKDNVEKVDFGGIDIERHLAKVIKSTNSEHNNIAKQSLRKIKQELCYVPIPCRPKSNKEKSFTENSQGQKKKYQLPDSSSIQLNQSLLEFPGMIFDQYTFPSLSQNRISLAEIITASICKCDYEVRQDMYSNMVLSGGNTCFRNFQQRLQKELFANKQSPANIQKKLKIINFRNEHLILQAGPFRNQNQSRNHNVKPLLSWIGGSILASLTSFEQHWITKEEYRENGKFIIGRCR